MFNLRVLWLEYYRKARWIPRLKILQFLAWASNQKPWYCIDFLSFTGTDYKFLCQISVENYRECNYIYVSKINSAQQGLTYSSLVVSWGISNINSKMGTSMNWRWMNWNPFIISSSVTQEDIPYWGTWQHKMDEGFRLMCGTISGGYFAMQHIHEEFGLR